MFPSAATHPGTGPVPAEFLRRPSGRGDGCGSEKLTNAVESGGGDGRRIRCAACRHAVTVPAARTNVLGAHQHTFFNPHGRVFTIGCFARAPGAVATGPPTDEFSWFAGHTWQVALCAACKAHLGWKFNSHVDSFWGLVLDTLMEDGGE